MTALALVAASCGSDSDSSSDTEAPDVTDEMVEETTAPEVTEPTDTEPESTEPTDTEAPDDVEGFAALAPADGDPIVVGMVNTEGAPGLDFPEIATSTQATVDFLNDHGGLGGRQIEFEVCTAAGSPETSQACAQELVGKGVDLIFLGLDLFPGFDTFTAADMPVTGVLPIFPGDYTADALYMTGGNTTTTAAMAKFAVEFFDAKTAGIISADNVGANGTEASLKAVLDEAGITYTSVKGGDNETDAGFQGLMAQATADDPDVLFSLYADAGCIGTMRGRTSPRYRDTGDHDEPLWSRRSDQRRRRRRARLVLRRGRDREDWYAGGRRPRYDRAVARLHRSIGARARRTLDPADDDTRDDGEHHDRRRNGDHRRLDVRAAGYSDDLVTWPDENPLACGSVSSIPRVCNFVFPIGTYVEGGIIETVPGFEALDTTDFL